MGLIRPKDHPHGMSEVQFAELFTDSVDDLRVSRIPRGDPSCRPWTSGCGPIPCPWLHRAGNHDDTVRHDGAEPGDALSPRHGRDQRHAALAGSTELIAWCQEKLREHSRYVVEHLEDLPEIRNWHLHRA